MCRCDNWKQPAFSGKIFHVKDMQAVLQIWGFSGWKVAVLAVVLIFINPVLEEMYWRVYIQNKVKSMFLYLLQALLHQAFIRFITYSLSFLFSYFRLI